MDTLLFNNINSFKIGNEDANIYIGDKLISRFRQVEYISSTYSGHQYIDLGCYLMSNTDDIQIDIKFNIKGKGFEVDKQATLINQQTDTSPYPGFVLRQIMILLNLLQNGNLIIIHMLVKIVDIILKVFLIQMVMLLYKLIIIQLIQ